MAKLLFKNYYLKAKLQRSFKNFVD